MAQTGRAVELAIIRQHYNPFGGAERFVENALQALSAERGLALTIFARQWPQGAAHQARCVQIDTPKKPNWLRDSCFARRVQAALAGASFDLVQSHERVPGVPLYRAGDGVHAAWLARRARWLPWYKQLGIYLSPYHWYVKRTERAMYRHPNFKRVICNSGLVRDEVLEHFKIPPDQISLIYNGVNTRHLVPATPDQQHLARERLALRSDQRVLLYVGSGYERKGVRFILQALSTLVPQVGGQGHSLTCLIVGHDKHQARYMRMADALGVGQYVRWCGPQNPLTDYWAAADGFVLPTIYDPCPNAALEALACGLPAFVSDACGVAELLGPLTDLCVHRCGDTAQLARQLYAWWAMSAEARQAMQHQARLQAEHVSNEHMTARLLEVYHQMLGTAPLQKDFS